MKQIFFRVDCTPQTGSGHLMRCLALAEVFQIRGATIHFIGQGLKGDISKQIEEKSFKIHHLTSLDKDAEQTKQILQNLRSVELLVIDHYDLNIKWEKHVRPFVKKILVIDDLANRSHDCDLLLDHGYYSNPDNRYQGLIPETCLPLIGPSYALIAQKFYLLRSHLIRKTDAVKSILIFFGSTDPTVETIKTLHALEKYDLNHLQIKIIVGAMNPQKEKINQCLLNLPNTTLLTNVENMPELMASADLFIGAGGITTWERFYLGLPSIVIAISDNQVPSSEELAKDGFILYLGKSGNVTFQMIQDAFSFLRTNLWFRKSLAEKGQALVDGKGCMRIANLLFPMPIKIRSATFTDCHSIFEWRNAEINRKHSFDPKEIKFEDHKVWFEKTLSDKNKILLIGELQKGSPVGVVRFDVKDSSATISVYLVPSHHYQGLGSILIHTASSWLQENYPEIKTITAEVKDENTGSTKAFLKAGFERIHQTYKLSFSL